MEKQEIIHITDRNDHLIEQLIRQKLEFWADHIFLTPLWWLGLALTVVPWVFFFFFRNKKSTDRLLYSALSVMVISLSLDVTGDQLGFWSYRYNVVPFLPTYVPWDLTLMPLAVTLLLQVKPRVTPYLKAILFSLLTAFVGEPFFAWLDIYDPTRWRYVYSLPIFFLIYLVAHYLSRRDAFQKLDS